MSSSKTSVFPGSKREAITNCGDLGGGVSRERREGQARCWGSGWRGMQRLHLGKGEVLSVPRVCWRWEQIHVTLCLHCAGHVPGAGK